MDKDWSKFKFMVFDIPNGPGTYAARYDRLGNYILYFIEPEVWYSQCSDYRVWDMWKWPRR